MVGDDDGNLSHWAARSQGDDGYIIVLTAAMLIPIMFFMSMGVDLGAWLATSSRAQRAADAAALAGVVWLPQKPEAETAALAAARANGFAAGTTVTVTPLPSTFATDYAIKVSTAAPTFFSQVLGVKSVQIDRQATARYSYPIALGSPANQFGNDPLGGILCPMLQPSDTCGVSPLVWGAINGPYNNKINGDPYSVKCPILSGSDTDVGSPGECDDTSKGNGAKNPDYKPDGYGFAIDVSQADVAAGRTLKLQVYDAVQIERDPDECNMGGLFSGFDGFLKCQTGDHSHSGFPGIDPAPLEVRVFDNDGLGMTVLYDKPLTGIEPRPQGAPSTECRLYVAATPSDIDTYKNKWVDACTFKPTKAGIYPVKLRSSGGMKGTTSNRIKDYSGTAVPDQGQGINGYALKVIDAGNANAALTTRLYALDDLSVFTNTPKSKSRFYLAEIGPEHAGKRIRLDLYDAGDGDGSSDYTVQVFAPPGGAPAVRPIVGTPTSCRYNANPSSGKGPGTPDFSPNCRLKTKDGAWLGGGKGIYQGKWMRVEITIPPVNQYKCSTGLLTGGKPDCWWTIEYDFGGYGQPFDRTVWSLQVLGDPIHLVD